MTRENKSSFWPNAGMRSLQAQIDELWGVVENADLYGGGSIAEQLITGVFPVTDHDANNAAVTEDIANQLKPDAYEVKNLGYGWYQVVDSDGVPVHGGKLRKAAATMLCEAKLLKHVASDKVMQTPE